MDKSFEGSSIIICCIPEQIRECMFRMSNYCNNKTNSKSDSLSILKLAKHDNMFFFFFIIQSAQ